MNSPVFLNANAAGLLIATWLLLMAGRVIASVHSRIAVTCECSAGIIVADLGLFTHCGPGGRYRLGSRRCRLGGGSGRVLGGLGRAFVVLVAGGGRSAKRSSSSSSGSAMLGGMVMSRRRRGGWRGRGQRAASLAPAGRCCRCA
ncbi:hypothetical protein B0J12DRAFT_375185 [Macrophomina phaseolina]|uniref:Uncharacterized protein n=1 Tax=Macrophomina phaseolina TaxID=35725 RepID=A0ABQ8GKA0_9PEZI|nr:hypothetical protein B0J12DRAFT_375185 [Macrophomina phaseolina]